MLGREPTRQAHFCSLVFVSQRAVTTERGAGPAQLHAKYIQGMDLPSRSPYPLEGGTTTEKEKR